MFAVAEKRKSEQKMNICGTTSEHGCVTKAMCEQAQGGSTCRTRNKRVCV